jgi:hypothetical protein
VPHVLTLDRGQVHVLTQVVVGRADAEGTQFRLSLKVFFGDLAFNDKGAYFDFFLDLLFALILNFSDDFL